MTTGAALNPTVTLEQTREGKQNEEAESTKNNKT